MREKALLTVVVPIYNVSEFLPKCIESIINQTYHNLEIILIDDGSTDYSGSICDEFARNDIRIKVIHKKNEGLVATRKYGVEISRGEVITFVDGDDWIEPDMYANMMTQYIENDVDLVTSGLIYDWGNEYQVQLDSVEKGVYDQEDIWNRILPKVTYDTVTQRQGITASVCNKLFSHRILRNIIDNLDMEVTLGEDGVIVYSIISTVTKMAVIDQAWYHYIQRDNSMIRTYGIESFEKIYRMMRCLKENIKEENTYNVMEKQIENYVKPFIWKTVMDVYEIDISPVSYFFSLDEVTKNKKVILYGAGKVGQLYYNYIKRNNYSKLVAWVDQNYDKYRACGMDVASPDDIKGLEFDYIVIAVADEKIKLEIEKCLLKYGVDEKKLIWRKCDRMLLI